LKPFAALFSILDFVFEISFGFRVSDFGFPAQRVRILDFVFEISFGFRASDFGFSMMPVWKSRL